MVLNNRLGVPAGNWFELTGEPRPVQNIGVASTASVLAGDALEADNCIHCHASYGHTILCPILNREAAEAKSAQWNENDPHKFGCAIRVISSAECTCGKADYTVSDWQYEVANGDTKLGYDEWLEHRIEANQ
jgi:hypothetical protein